MPRKSQNIFKGVILTSLMIATSLVAQVDESCPSTAYEAFPKLLTSFEPFKEAVRTQRYTGRVVIELMMSDTGTVSDPRIISPVRLNFVKVIKERILEWKFCPAVLLGRYNGGKMRLEVEVRP